MIDHPQGNVQEYVGQIFRCLMRRDMVDNEWDRFLLNCRKELSLLHDHISEEAYCDILDDAVIKFTIDDKKLDKESDD